MWAHIHAGSQPPLPALPGIRLMAGSTLCVSSASTCRQHQQGREVITAGTQQIVAGCPGQDGSPETSLTKPAQRTCSCSCLLAGWGPPLAARIAASTRTSFVRTAAGGRKQGAGQWLFSAEETSDVSTPQQHMEGQKVRHGRAGQALFRAAECTHHARCGTGAAPPP